MDTRSVDLATPDGAMRLYEAVPDGEPTRAVVVIMEAFGLNDHIEDVTRRFADQGYYAVAPDLFHRAGKPPAPYDDFAQVMALFEGVTDATVESDLGAVLAHLGGAGFATESIGITGFCWGGWVTFLGATRQPFGAAVTWYGGGIVSAGALPFPSLVDDAGSLDTPWLGLFGELDGMIPGSDLDQLQAALDAGQSEAHEIVRYADADHGFHCDGRPDVFNAEAAAAGWERALAWFDTHLTG